MGLRRKLIEPIANRLADRDMLIALERIDPSERERELTARGIIDDLLGVLETHADEWADWNAAKCADADEGCNCVSDEQVYGLLAVLREPSE